MRGGEGARPSNRVAFSAFGSKRQNESRGIFSKYSNNDTRPFLTFDQVSRSAAIMLIKLETG